MAIKPKKEMTDAQKAKLKKMLSQGGNLDKPTIREKGRKTPLTGTKKASTKYSPAPMSAAAKKKAAAAGKATGAKTKPKSLASKVVKRAAITAREARDVVTAAGTVAKGVKESRKFYGGYAVKNLKKQIAETGRAAVSGKRGTESDQIVSSPNYKGASGGFTGRSRDKAKNKPGKSITEAIDWYKKSKN